MKTSSQIDTDDQARHRALIRDLEVCQAVKDERILEVLARVPRHAFVRPGHQAEAYANYPLPIGGGQTISQPLVVGIMTDALRVRPGDRVLEVGTGSGYQAAVLSEAGARVYTIEVVASLSAWGAGNLRRAGYENVHVQVGDGYLGWEEQAPFDGIIVTAAPDHIPNPLLKQLRLGGRMVVPVGRSGLHQTLWLIERLADEIRETNLGAVAFVPLTGPHARAGDF